MDKRFDYFVVFAEMRTGSNFLEANLNAFPGLSCVGEAFNPHFIGYPNQEECLGVSEEERNRDPERLIAAVKNAQGLAGFRYFHDHEPRVLDAIINDTRCAKIILTRNPVDSYVSWKIAQATGQWKLTNVAKRKDAKAHFDGAEFEQHLENLQAFQVFLMNELQRSGQTAFYVDYEDLQDVGIMNGLATFLEQPDRLEGLDKKLKRQNPSPVREKVDNVEEMETTLARLDRFNLSRTPNFEPRRGAAVPGYIACARAGLMYLPVRSGPEAEVRAWMAALDGVGDEALQTGFNQKSLRQWMRGHTGHRSFTVLRHPVARVHHAFCSKILDTGEGTYGSIRRTLRRVHKLPIPEGAVDETYDVEAHRAAFKVFLDFVRANINGQTAVRNDAHWCTQASAIQSMGQFALPDFVLREEELAAYLPAVALQVGYGDAPEPGKAGGDTPFGLEQIYDDEIESLAQEAYQRDYLVFGFDRWR